MGQDANPDGRAARPYLYKVALNLTLTYKATLWAFRSVRAGADGQAPCGSGP